MRGAGDCGPGSRSEVVKPWSDLDLVIIGDARMTPRDLGELREALEESTLPIRVDLVDWHATSPAFREAIAAQAVLLAERHEHLRANRRTVDAAARRLRHAEERGQRHRDEALVERDGGRAEVSDDAQAKAIADGLPELAEARGVARRDGGRGLDLHADDAPPTLEDEVDLLPGAGAEERCRRGAIAEAIDREELVHGPRLHERSGPTRGDRVVEGLERVEVRREADVVRVELRGLHEALAVVRMEGRQLVELVGDFQERELAAPAITTTENDSSSSMIAVAA